MSAPRPTDRPGRGRADAPAVYVRAEDAEDAALFASQVPTFLALTKNCKSVEVVRDMGGVPAGCGSEVLTPTIFTQVLVRVRVSGRAG